MAKGGFNAANGLWRLDKRTTKREDLRGGANGRIFFQKSRVENPTNTRKGVWGWWIDETDLG